MMGHWRRILLFGTLLPLLVSATTAQSGYVSGHVYDALSGEPLKGAGVVVKDSLIGTSTDDRGSFLLGPLPAGPIVIVISHLGRESQVHSLVLEPSATVRLEVRLADFAVQIPEVLVEQASMTGGLQGVRDVPGSAHYIGPRELQRFAHQDAHRILRGVPGLNLQEEDGYGLLPNIGIRGTGAERSSKITVMEDGVPIAPAPYAAPSAYYFPTMGRMSGIEVRKGSSQIKYGPATTGGAINLLSTPIPEKGSVRARVLAGSERNVLVHLSAGESRGTIGWLLEAYRESSSGFKQLDGGGNTGFGRTDLVAKIRWSTPRGAAVHQSLTLKASLADQLSNETYLGLTDADFALAPLRRYAASREDLMDAEQRQVMARHRIRPMESVEVVTTAYHTRFRRNWYKLDRVRTDADGVVPIAEILGDPGTYPDAYRVVSGTAGSLDHRLDVKANNRSYRATGVQTDVTVGNGERAVEFGLRLHRDEMDRFQWVDGWRLDGLDMTLVDSGIPGTDSNRIERARALAAYAQPRLSIGRFALYPGLRLEMIEQTRDDYGKIDVERTGREISIRRNVSTALIPGFGVSSRLETGLTIFGGVHSGFAPPGTTEGARPERSVNYEIGTRLDRSPAAMEVVVYLNDYSNLLGADLAAGGGTGSTDLFNGGRARVSGLELSAHHNLGRLVGWRASLPVRLVYSRTHARFASDFESSFEPWGVVRSGDRLPYVAPHQVFGALGIEFGLAEIEVAATWVGTMPTVAGARVPEAHERIDSHLVIDLSVSVTLTGPVNLFATVRNLTDEVYVAARRPAGVRPGLPRTALAGLRAAF